MRAKPKRPSPRRKKIGSKKIVVRSQSNKRVPGSLKGKIHVPDSAFAPMTKEELAEWGIE